MALEKRRLGLARKPMVVVPNHLVQQWARDVLRLYPAARVLASTKKDFTPDRRKRFLNRIATHILAFEGDSHVEWFEGNFSDYETDKKRRLGIESIIPKKLKYKKFSR